MFSAPDTQPDEKVALDLTFRKPFKGRNAVDIDLIPHGETTEVKWVMRGELNLANLKRVAE